MPPGPWLLLVHQLPARPLYLRAKVRRHLAQAGALPLKNSVYVLPAGSVGRARFESIAAGVSRDGGEAHVCEARFLGAGVDEDLADAFRRQSESSYAAVRTQVRRMRAAARRPGRTLRRKALHALRRRLEAAVAVDHFQAPVRAAAEVELARLEAEAEETAREAGRLLGRTWVTRKGVLIDRIASAWLIRRFVDPRARFRFLDSPEEERRADELAFDVPGGDFTHEGDRCTFETLVARCGLRDPALASLAQVVHDVDLKDGKFDRPEAAGVERVLKGLVSARGADEDRIAAGFDLFDALYAAFRPGSRSRRRLGP